MVVTNSTNSFDNLHFMHPWESMECLGQNERAEIEVGEGIYVYDAKGRKFIDGPGGMWCVQIGYGHPEMTRAIADQVQKLPYYSSFNNTNSNSAELAHEIAKRTPGDLNRIFFTTGGSTAVDSALRFVQFRNNILGKPEKKKIISLARSYHGSTYLSASVSSRDRYRTWLDKEEDLVHFLSELPSSSVPKNTHAETHLDVIAQDLENSIVKLGPENVAAFIAEPIQASGGVRIPVEGFHKRCLEICRKYDVLYISDEVVTGFGRLGHWFASEELFEIVPDIITCAKGMTSGYLPMGAVAISERLIGEVMESSEAGTIFANGFTYSGHPVCAAAALKNMEIIEREGVLENVRKNSPLFLERLHALSGLESVVETRGIGLVGCVECSRNNDLEDDQNVGAQIDSFCHELGLLVRPVVNMCILSPPLIINEDQINQMFDILEQGIRSV